MKPDEINRSIAKKCGTLENVQTKVLEFDYNGDVVGHHTIQSERYPDYYYDLNAVHKAESSLTDTDPMLYVAALDAVCVPVHICPTTHTWALIHATAPQRCEALLRTWGLWNLEEK